MCLDKQKDFSVSGVGYKILEESAYNDCYTIQQGLSKPIPFNEKVNEADYRFPNLLNEETIKLEFNYSDGQFYDTGFHIFCTKHAAINYIKRQGFGPSYKFVKIFKVTYSTDPKNICATGLQNGCKSVVVKEMTVIKKEN